MLSTSQNGSKKNFPNHQKMSTLSRMAKKDIITIITIIVVYRRIKTTIESAMTHLFLARRL